MTRTKNIFLYLMILSFLAGSISISGSFAADDKEEFIVPVFATSAKKGTIKETLKVTGTIYSSSSVKVSSKATGQVKSIYFEEGDVVKAGDILLKIDAETAALRLKQSEEGVRAAKEIHKKSGTAIKLEQEQIELQVNLATSNLEAAQALYEKAKTGARPEEKKQAQASMLSAESSKKNAEANFKRMEELFKKKTVSKQQYDLEKMQYEVAKAQYDIAKESFNLVQAGLRKEDIKAAEANFNSATTALNIAESFKLKLELLKNDVAAALANLKQAEYEKKIAAIMLDDTLVRAPIGGIISKKLIEEGEIIQAPGIPLFTLLNQSSMKVKVNIPESKISQVQKGVKTLVEVDSYPGREFFGTVNKLGATVDIRLRTLEVEITVKNDELLLKEGMFTRVSIYTNIRDNAVYVPLSALVKRNGDEFVFTVNGEHPKKNRVTSGLVEGDNVEIVSGLSAGDEVIYRGNPRLEENMKISVERK